MDLIETAGRGEIKAFGSVERRGRRRRSRGRINAIELI
jgi:hypothetical protein